MRRPADAVRLEHPSGTAGVLLPRPPWSAEVRDLTGPDPDGWLADAAAEARRQGALDLRSASALPGFTPLDPATGEHVRPLAVALADAPATRALGRRLAPALARGDLLVLSGPLGAGKTTFAQGLGEALGVRGRVTSPTFVLARLHRGPLPLVHVDAYRLREAGGPAGPLDLEDLDLDAALEDAVTVVEWGEGLVESMAASRLEVRLDRGPVPSTGSDEADGAGRRALVRAVGRRWAALPSGTAEPRREPGR